MTVNCIVQARMGSTRLPGKVMKEVNGKPLIGYLIDRLLQCRNIDKIVVAIPERDLQSSLGIYLGSRPVNISTGPEDDVAKRFSIALKAYPCVAFVRVCADSPLISPHVVDCMAGISGEYWLLGSIPGSQAEKFNTKAFLEAVPLMAGTEREHLIAVQAPWFGRPMHVALEELGATPNDV